MANFQIGHSKLFPDGTQLFANGKSGEEKLVLHHDTTIQSRAGRNGSDQPASPGGQSRIIQMTAPRKAGNKWVFAVTPAGTGRVTLGAVDFRGTAASDLTVIAGVFKPYKDDKGELEEDPYRRHLPRPTIGEDVCAHQDPRQRSRQSRQRKFGSQCEAMGRAGLRHGRQGDRTGIVLSTDRLRLSPLLPEDPAEIVDGRQVWKIDDRSDVKYDRAKLTQGEKAIQARLKKGQPCLVGITYIPKDASGRRHVGRDERGRAYRADRRLRCGCETIPCSSIPMVRMPPIWPADSHRSNLQYTGGMEGLNTFPDKCRYLGMFEDKDDPDRGPVRASPGVDRSAAYSAPTISRVISGPL